jgi:cell division protein FtsN
MTSPIDTPHGRRLPVLFAFVAIAVAAFLLSAGGAAVASSHSIRPARDTSRAGPAAAAEEEVDEEVDW